MHHPVNAKPTSVVSGIGNFSLKWHEANGQQNKFREGGLGAEERGMVQSQEGVG